MGIDVATVQVLLDVAPELLTGAFIPVPSEAGAHLEDEHAYAGPQMCKIANTVSMDTVIHRKKSVLMAYKLPAVFLCGICGVDCKEDPSSLSQHRIDPLHDDVSHQNNPRRALHCGSIAGPRSHVDARKHGRSVGFVS